MTQNGKDRSINATALRRDFGDLHAVDGVDLINSNDTASINTLNAGLFPATAGETHSFTVIDTPGAASRVVTMQIIDEVIDAATDDVVAATQLIDEMMPTRAVQPAEAKHARLGETR